VTDAADFSFDDKKEKALISMQRYLCTEMNAIAHLQVLYAMSRVLSMR